MPSSLDDLLNDAASLAAGGDWLTVSPVASPLLGGAPARVEGVVLGDDSLFEGTGSSKRCYSVVLVRGFDRSLCFGVVGVGTASFCIRKNCKIKSHVENKIGGYEREDSYFFISRVNEATVFSEPCVKEVNVPIETQAEWKEKLLTLPHWVRVFGAISLADDSAASSDDIKAESKFLADADRFKTPSKKRKAGFARTTVEGVRKREIVSFEVHKRELPEEGDPTLDLVIADGSLGKGGLTKIVARLESSMIELGKAVDDIAGVTHERFMELDENVHLVSGAVQNIMSGLGPSVGMDMRFEAPTLWGATSFIGDEVVRLSDEALSYIAQFTSIQGSLQMIIKRVSEFSGSLSTEDGNAKMLKILTLVMGRVHAINPELDKIRKHIAKIEAEVEATSDSRSKRQKVKAGASGEGAMDDLMALLTSGATMKDSIDSGRSTPSEKGKAGTGADYERVASEDLVRVEVSMTQLSREVALIVADVGLLKACAEDKSIKFGGLGLRSLQECHSWIDDNFKGLRYGLIMDPLLMLDRIFGSDDVEAESQFKILESRVKLKITTGAEAAAIKALHFNRPRLFHKGRVAMTSERNTSKLSKLPTYKSWKSGGEGVRNYVTKQMNLIHSTVTHDIAYAFGSDPTLSQAQSLATTSLNATITFLTQMMGFIDTIYEKLHLHSKFSGDQAWSLTTQILDRICEDLYAPKEGVAAAMTVEDPSSICSHLLWSCFRTHDVMTGYIEHNFENHPAISAEYVKFLATNSGYDKVEKMEVLLATVKENVTKALDYAEKASKKAEAAETKFSAANKELEGLKKRVQVLENKGNK